MTELAALNVRITGDAGDLNAAVNSAKTQLGGLNTAIAQTQAKAGAMGGTLGGLASRFSSARGQIQNVSYQLQDISVQFQAGTAASVIFAQQGSQIASAFGPVGAVIGAVLAVTPLLALAFSSASDEAQQLSDAAERQKASLEALTLATYNLRLERQMMASGAGFAEEQEALNEINRLEKERADIVARINQLSSAGGRAAGYKAQADAAREVLQAELDGIQAKIDALNYQRELGVAERRRANELRNDFREEKAAQDALRSSMVTAYGLYARTRMEAAALASETLRAAGAFANMQQSLADRGMVYSGRGGDPRKTTPAGASPFVYGGPQLDQFNNPIAKGGRANPIQSQLEALQESLMSQEQLEADSFARRQETLKAALQQRLISQQEHAALMEQVEKTHQFAMTKETNAGVQATLGHLGQLFQGSKKIGAAIALANSWVAFTEVLKDPAYIGRPWARIAAAGAALSSGLNAVRNIKSAQPGGSASGGAGGGAGMAGGANAAPQQTSNISLQLVGGDLFSRDQVLRLINSINEATADGARISLR
jgi:chromosome segregation ATPase